MDIRYLDRLLANAEEVSHKIRQYLDEKTIIKTAADKEEIKGHLLKASHNLIFVSDNLALGHLDWCVTGCYYAVYQASLALILLKGYSSKNHDATLCILIKEYYKKEVDAKEIELLNAFYLDYQEILFYVQSKHKREDASYSTKIKFDKPTVDELRLKAILFVEKAKQIVENSR